MMSEKPIFRIFAFGFHNLRKHQEIPLITKNWSILLRIDGDMATCVLALPTLCQNNSDSLANFKSFIGHITTDFRRI